jgi:hypothetical protein
MHDAGEAHVFVGMQVANRAEAEAGRALRRHGYADARPDR